MGEYRRVYTKFELTAGSGRARRLVTGEGRGSGPDGYFSYASFSGVYHRGEPLLQCIPLFEWMTVRKILIR